MKAQRYEKATRAFIAKILKGNMFTVKYLGGGCYNVLKLKFVRNGVLVRYR